MDLARLLSVSFCALVASCHAAPASTRPAPRQTFVVFSGMCDASGAVALSERLFAVADDEDNVLRTYDATRGGAPSSSLDISAAVGVLPRGSASSDKPPPEIDIEAATRLGDVALWLGSHGRSSAGKLKRERLRMFATTLPREGAPMQVVGSAYDGLLEALFADERYRSFGLEQAAERAPKLEGGLNIEGVTMRPEGGVYIGFRNPIPEGRALLASLENPEQVVRGASARLGPPTLLALGGLGIRDLTWWHGAYWIVAGDRADRVPSRLYRWDGRGAPQQVAGVDLSQLNPEALFVPDGAGRMLILSDDGAHQIDGVECKKLEDASRKRFRALWLTLP